jgi:hypothetical protein
MKKNIVFLLLFIVNFCYSQTYHGIDVLNPDISKFKYENEMYVLEKNIFYYEGVIYQPKENSVAFATQTISGLYFKNIYEDLVEYFNRKEDKNKDYVSDYMNTYDLIVISCTIGQSEIVRIWYEEKFTCLFYIGKDVIMVNFYIK